MPRVLGTLRGDLSQLLESYTRFSDVEGLGRRAFKCQCPKGGFWKIMATGTALPQADYNNLEPQ